MVIYPQQRIAGRLTVPGDKGISHRALMIGAGVGGSVTIHGLAPGGDVASTISCLRDLGRKLDGDLPNPQHQVERVTSRGSISFKLEGQPGWADFRQGRTLDCGNSGTTMRFLLGILAGGKGRTTLVGDESLSSRPMRRVADPLARMGASINPTIAGTAPIVVEGRRLRGISFEAPVPSAQVKSAILLAGLQAEGRTTVLEPAPSRDHTERLLRFLGVAVDVDGKSVSVEPTQLFGDKEIKVPGDFSAASFLLTAAAIIPDGDVTIDAVGLNPTRTGFLDVLRSFGASVELTGLTQEAGEPRGTVRVRAGDRRPPEVRVDEGSIDELPLVAVLAAVAEGRTEVRGAGELRVKESDRIAAVVAGLGAMGADIEPLDDGFVVRGPASLRGESVRSFGDHRIAMALAVAGLTATGETHIDGWECVGISYPEFAADLEILSGA